MLAPSKTCRACGKSFVAGEVFCPGDGSRLLSQARTDAAVDPLIGDVLDGRYRILRVLGEGGMGIVYEAQHALIDRRVAIKVLREDFCRRADVVERFRREAKSASRIGHPNIVDVLDFGETPTGASYFVMEMLEGQDLADQLARSGALAPERAVLIAYQCCHALGAAHDKGIVHRDLKPENIFLVEREGAADFVKLVDFGVAKINDLELDAAPKNGGHAKLTRTGMIFGTPEYMSPEQATGLPPDHRVDIYALGITLYELLTGRVPFEGPSFMSVLSKHASKQVPALRVVNPRLKISPELERIVMRALCKNRDQRFLHMRDMAAELRLTPEMPALPFRLTLPSTPGAARLSPVPGSSSVPPVSTVTAASPETTTRDFELKLKRARKLEIAALALSVAAGLGIYAVSSRGRLSALHTGAARSGHVASQPRAQDASPARAFPASGSAEPGQAALDVHGLDLVTLRVTTQPPGARVRLAGGEEVCGSTPCSFDVVRGAPVSLKAQRGARQAVTTLSPKAATELHLVLDAQTPKPLASARDDLKVPSIFRDRAK